MVVKSNVTLIVGLQIYSDAELTSELRRRRVVREAAHRRTLGLGRNLRGDKTDYLSALDMDLIDTLTKATRPLRVREIADSVGLGNGSARRCLGRIVAAKAATTNPEGVSVYVITDHGREMLKRYATPGMYPP